MSRKLLAFLLSELNTVRVICQGTHGGSACGYTVEVPLDRLAAVYRATEGVCPICRKPFGYFGGAGTMQDAFGPLAVAMQHLAKIKDNVQIEFVVRDPSEDSARQSPTGGGSR